MTCLNCKKQVYDTMYWLVGPPSGPTDPDKAFCNSQCSLNWYEENRKSKEDE